MEVLRIPRILNQELVLLIALSLVAVGAFIFTRRLAARERQLETKIAAVWFQRGEDYLRAGQTDKAIQAFRKATSDIGDNQKYVLALASALAAEKHSAEAQQLLLRLRESDPEDPEINIHLARLAASQNDTQQAVHYYQSALYGRWPSDQVNERRKLRFELVHFLLDHQQRELATSELLILQARTPDSAAAHVELAKLFVEAGDALRALAEYSEAARLENTNGEALTGAGNAAFQLGEYGKAEQFLRAALKLDPDSPRTRQLLTLTQLVQGEDPLAPHLSALDRQKRLLSDLERSANRVDDCLSQSTSAEASAELQALKAEALTAVPKLSSKSHSPDSDAVRSGIGLMFRMQQAASAACGVPTMEDQALLLIGRQHSGDRP